MQPAATPAPHIHALAHWNDRRNNNIRGENLPFFRKYTMRWYEISWIPIPASWTYLKTRKAISECRDCLLWEHLIWAGYDVRKIESRKGNARLCKYYKREICDAHRKLQRLIKHLRGVMRYFRWANENEELSSFQVLLMRNNRPHSKLFLIDLAGSERASNTNVSSCALCDSRRLSEPRTAVKGRRCD